MHGTTAGKSLCSKVFQMTWSSVNGISAPETPSSELQLGRLNTPSERLSTGLHLHLQAAQGIGLVVWEQGYESGEGFGMGPLRKHSSHQGYGGELPVGRVAVPVWPPQRQRQGGQRTSLTSLGVAASLYIHNSFVGLRQAVAGYRGWILKVVYNLDSASDPHEDWP
jgi:hypothetical protein